MIWLCKECVIHAWCIESNSFITLPPLPGHMILRPPSHTLWPYLALSGMRKASFQVVPCPPLGESPASLLLRVGCPRTVWYFRPVAASMARLAYSHRGRPWSPLLHTTPIFIVTPLHISYLAWRREWRDKQCHALCVWALPANHLLLLSH